MNVIDKVYEAAKACLQRVLSVRLTRCKGCHPSSDKIAEMEQTLRDVRREVLDCVRNGSEPRYAWPEYEAIFDSRGITEEGP